MPNRIAGNWTQGLRSLWDLTRHLTARADDTSRIIELNHMLHRLCGPPSIPLSFSLATVLPRWGAYRFRLAADILPPTTSAHRLRRGLPGYLILFDPHAFVPERQCRPGELPSLSAFCGISTHFTATRHVPPASTAFQPDSINGTSGVGPRAFTADLTSRLRTL